MSPRQKEVTVFGSAGLAARPRPKTRALCDPRVPSSCMRRAVNAKRVSNNLRSPHYDIRGEERRASSAPVAHACDGAHAHLARRLLYGVSGSAGASRGAVSAIAATKDAVVHEDERGIGGKGAGDYRRSSCSSTTTSRCPRASGGSSSAPARPAQCSSSTRRPRAPFCTPCTSRSPPPSASRSPSRRRGT